MSQRAAILISCLEEEAKEIRLRAKRDQRSVSSYLLKTLMRWVEFEEKLYGELSRYLETADAVFARRPEPPRGPRTTILETDLASWRLMSIPISCIASTARGSTRVDAMPALTAVTRFPANLDRNPCAI